MQIPPENDVTGVQGSITNGSAAIDKFRFHQEQIASGGARLPNRLACHRWQWMQSLRDGLGHEPFLVSCETDGRCIGSLPLGLVQSRLFGRFLVSLPYLNTGGVWCESDEIGRQLIDAACELADRLDVKYLELRHECPVEHAKFNFVRTDKMHLRLALPRGSDELMASFKSKLRSQVKKSLKESLAVQFGGKNCLDAFYEVFAHNMRDLGTPVFSKGLFASILDSFGNDAEICVVRHDGVPAASALLIHGQTVTEVPSASCRREYNRNNANMRMYWHLLDRAIERGSETFDFGRSSEGSGTYKFKQQWGAAASPACWQYYVRHGDPASMRPDADGKKRLVEAWKRLPVWATKWIGPPIVRGIP